MNFQAGEYEAAQLPSFVLPGAKTRYAPDRVCDLKHIKIEASFDFSQKKVFGTTTLWVEPINEGLRHLELDAVEMMIKRVALSTGMPLGYEYLGGRLRIDLGKPRRSGEEVIFSIEYEAQPRRGLYFISPNEAYPNKPVQIWSQGQDEDSRHWFPCFDYPNERATSELIATVPSKYFALSNGKLIHMREDASKGVKTYHWKQSIPHVSYLITLVVGEYVELKEAFDGIPVLYYVYPGREADARRSFGNTPDMLNFFSEKIGIKYPYEKYAQVVVADFIFGGMENTTATTLTDTTLHDARAHLDFSSDGLVAHELAHQWWGDLLTCKDWSHGWLNEGFATYFDALYTEHHKGVDEFRHEINEDMEAYFREDRERYRRPIVFNIYDEPVDLFDRHLYQKAACVLHMLRFVLGDDLFWKSLQHYAQKFREKTVDTTDLLNAICEATGKNLEWFFAQWIHKAGHPEFKVAYNWDETYKQVQLTVSQTQKTDEWTPIFRTPIEIAIATSHGVERVRIEIVEPEQRFYLLCAERPKMVSFDVGNWILKKLDFSLPEEMLVYQLGQDRDCMGRIRAAEGLGKTGSPQAVKALRQALLRDPYWGVQAAAAKALGNWGTTSAREALIAGLEIEHPKARRAVVRALGEFKNDESVAEKLVEILRRGDASYYVEAEAATSLGKTRFSRAFEELKQALAKDSFNEVIRAGVFEGFSQLRDERAIAICKEWTQYGKPSQARQAAVVALGKLGEGKREIGEFLIDFLRDSDFRVRLQTLTALRELKDERTIPALGKFAEQSLDGREKRLSREIILKLKEGQNRSEEIKKLREDLEKFSQENRQLRDRLDRLESSGHKSTPATNGHEMTVPVRAPVGPMKKMSAKPKVKALRSAVSKSQVTKANRAKQTVKKKPRRK